MMTAEISVTAAEYARMRGVTGGHIKGLRHNGRLVLDESGLILPVASDALIACTQTKKPRKGSASARPGHPWVIPAAEYAEPLLEALHGGGGLTQAARRRQVERAIGIALTELASRIAPKVARESDPAFCRTLIMADMKRVLARLTSIAMHSPKKRGKKHA
jgi:hypothetical protein